jgi:hypothetical protein
MSSLASPRSVKFDPDVGCMPSAVVRALADANPSRKLKAIEIGTGYGYQLTAYGALGRVLCVDPMYDWVPDVGHDERYDASKTDERKLADWLQNASTHKNAILFVGTSQEVRLDPTFREMAAGADVIIIDGCHHPWRAVAEDYWWHEELMADEHYVVFDDVHDADPKLAFDNVARELRNYPLFRYVDDVTFHMPKDAVTTGVLRVKRPSPPNL